MVRDAGVRVRNSVRNVEGDADRGRAAHGARRLSLPQLVAIDGHHRPGAAGVGAHVVRAAADVRLHAQHDVAARPVARDRHSDRRRDRRAREHRATRRDGRRPHARRARGHRRDRARRHGDDVLDRRRVRAGRIHARHRRAVLQAVRAHDRGGGARVALRVVLARPDALGVLARSAARGARASQSDRASARAVQPVVRPRRPIATSASSRWALDHRWTDDRHRGGVVRRRDRAAGRRSAASASRR